jgi:hypothetical protein
MNVRSHGLPGTSSVLLHTVDLHTVVLDTGTEEGPVSERSERTSVTALARGAGRAQRGRAVSELASESMSPRLRAGLDPYRRPECSEGLR